MNGSVQTSDREQIRVKFLNVNGCESQQGRGFQGQNFLRGNQGDGIQLTTARRQRAGRSAYTLPQWMDGEEDWGGVVTAVHWCPQTARCCQPMPCYPHAPAPHTTCTGKRWMCGGNQNACEGRGVEDCVSVTRV